MNRTAFLVIATAFISGCTTYGKDLAASIPNSCGGTGHTLTWIQYGDSHLSALAMSDIGRKAEWRFLLQPERRPGPVPYTDAIVTVTGKTPADAWVNVSGKHSDDPVMTLCVPDSLPVGTDVNYMISVQWVGELDPRAKVVR